MLTRAQAAGVLEIDARALNQLVAEGQIHAMLTVTGSLRVCKDSLFASSR